MSTTVLKRIGSGNDPQTTVLRRAPLAPQTVPIPSSSSGISPSVPAPRSLAYYEGLMAQGLPNLGTVALALVEIHQHRLYRKRYRSFQAYLRQRWHFSRARGYQMLHIARLRQLSTRVKTTGPQNERKDPIMRAVEYVVGVFEKLPAVEQTELIFYLRDMLTGLEKKLTCKVPAPPYPSPRRRPNPKASNSAARAGS